MTYILYNPDAGIDEGHNEVQQLQQKLENATMCNICDISDYRAFFAKLSAQDKVIVCGGDGTLNHFANGLGGLKPENEIFYFPMGTGNDFARDLGREKYADPSFCINAYLENLPSVSVKGMDRVFLNNVGFGIDGYCSVTGDAQREQNKRTGKTKPVNYTMIAIQGLLFHFKPRNAVITVDGKEYRYKKVWLAPTMNGRFYGSGMMATPNQDRLNKDGKVSVMLFHDVGSLHALMIFPSIFTGKHVAHTKQVTVLEGHNIHVAFDRPTPVQIDGEVVNDVLEYSVTGSVPTAARKEQAQPVGV